MYAAVRPVEIPRLPVADIIVQNERLILREHPHGIDPGIHTVGKRKIDDTVLAAVRYGGFCDFACQGVQPAALSAREKHCHTFLFSEHLFTPYIF